MIIGWLNSWFSWLKKHVQAAWARLEEKGPELQDKARQAVGGFFTSPLSETEYALLKRVSGIVGTAVAVYITLMAGPTTAVVVFCLCLFFSFGLYKVTFSHREVG